MKNVILLTIALFTVSFSSSCGDKCDDVTCLNNGVCDEGVCDCPAGFEGDLCQTMTSSRITGNYNVFTACEGDEAPTETWSVSQSASAANEIILNNFHKPALNVVAVILDPNTIEIKEQFFTIEGVGYTITGSGVIDRENNLNVSYQVVTDIPAATFACIADATR